MMLVVAIVAVTGSVRVATAAVDVTTAVDVTLTANAILGILKTLRVAVLPVRARVERGSIYRAPVLLFQTQLVNLARPHVDLARIYRVPVLLLRHPPVDLVLPLPIKL
jgi:hypothetical protein